jgi:microsomal epoxide hydrolase
LLGAAGAALCTPRLARAAPAPPSSADVAIVRGRLVTSDGVALSRLEAGHPGGAPTLVFVPGWCMPAEIFRPQLAALGSDHRVIAFDPRGQGESDVPASGYTLERRTLDLADLLDPLSDVLLVGWSLGVLEALEYVAVFGQRRLAGLMLVDNSIGEPPAPRPGNLIARLREDRQRAVAGFVRSMFGTPPSDAVLARLTAQAQRMPLEASIALLSYPRPREHWRDIARAVSRPLCYAVTPRFAAQADSLRQHRPATRVEVFERAGHALFVDEATRFNALVRDFAAALARR